MPLRHVLPPSLADDMPPPSVELTLLGVMLRAHLKCLPPKKRRVFLENIMETWEELDASANVVRLRGREHDEGVMRTRRQGVAWTRGMMAAYLMHDI